MNKIYKVIWNIQLGCWQAVSELAKNRSGATKSTTTSTIINKDGASTSRLGKRLSALLLFSLALLPLSIHAAIQNNALPTGGTVTAGTAQIVQNGNTLNIQQNSQNLSSNWNTFNIGQDATVNFNQPNQSSVAINHVLDPNASQIMGRLNANGQVFLLNPNGVVFSKTAQVNVGGIVASTLNLTDQDLQNGQYTLKGDANSNASVENHGTIHTLQGGTVALIAPNVRNTGSINTPNGITHLSAASQVTLALQDGSLTQYQVDQGVLQGLVDNGGAIIANNGAVYLTAKAKGSLSKAVINHSGIIEANRLTQNARGEIVLLGDMQNGETHVSGILKAEGKNGQNGGLIETSAANVKIDDRTQVSTRSEGGKTGTWRIDPTDFTISAGNGASGSSGIGATTLQNNLSTNNVILETQAAGSGAGDIHVNAAVSWNAATELTLKAHNNININADISAADNNGKLHLIYGQNTANSNANYYLNHGAKVNLKAGDNFSTQKGIDAVKNYKVITALGAQGSTTQTDLQGINGNLTGNYVLGADIDASATSGWNSGAGFNPLGNNTINFSGVLDGLGHTISNLTINRPSTDYVGLFGQTNGASIRNIGLLGGSVTGQQVVGGLVGFNDNGSSISNAYTTGSVAGLDYVGGLVGYNYSGSINNAYATGAVTGQGSVGGLVGFNNSTISNAYATGLVTGQNYVGGLVGYNYSSSISNAYATGAVIGQYSVGGLVGFNDSSSISNAYATGAVTGGINIGGLLGFYNNGSISNAYWNMETTGQTTSAGGIGLTTAQMFDQANLIGLDFNNIWGNGDNQTTPYLKNLANNQVFNKNDLPSGVISTTNRPALYTAILNVMQLQNINNNLNGRYVIGNNIDASDTVNWNSAAGFNPLGNNTTQFSGILDGLGNKISNLTINRPTTDYVGLFGRTNGASIRNIGLLGGSVTGRDAVGGLVGLNNNSNISNAYATGSVTGANSSVGGLVGYNNSSSISNAYATGSVTGQYAVGGLVGENGNSSSISNAYATGAVTGGQNYIGGLVGYNNSNISNAYATGAVTGQFFVGGLVGVNTNNSSISNAYATGAVTGNQFVGGLVGSGGNISNAYWNMETTGQTTSAGGTGLTTAQMFNQSNLTGFDFSNIWGNGENQTTPYLKNLANNQVFNKNDLPSGVIFTTNRPALYTAILNVMQLQNINNNLNGRYVIGNNIDASDTVNWNSGAGFNPLGNYPTSFSGKFDGLGHTISNLMINRPFTFESIGLFGITNGASIRNIGLLGGSVTGQYSVGGLVGYNDNNSTISNAYVTGTVIGSQNVGGLVGWNNNNSSISNAYATGVVTGSNTIGGLVGSNAGSIINTYTSAAVTGGDQAGGLVGINWSGTISDSYATGSVTGSNSVGGLVGNNGSSISDSYATGAVTGSNSVGGLVGNNGSSIINTYATGAVTGFNFVGGLVGFNTDAVINNAYATGSVTGNNSVGGLAGHNQLSSIINAYATGAVTGNTNVGGLVGVNYNSSISNAYWNMETTGQTTSAGGTGLTTAQMFNQSNLTGFDFSNIWGNGENQTTPYLKNLANNQVFNKNDLPSGVISTTNRPALYTAILNAMQLQNINNNLSGRYVIGNNIDASDTVNWNSGAGFNPLGNLSTQFSGVFDGLGHTISNLTINRPTTYYVGLFGKTNSASIRNIGLLDGAVTGRKYVGGLVGHNSNNSSISTAYTTGSVRGEIVGGLVGENNNGSSISNAYAMGTVAGLYSSRVGGLVGSNSGSISNAYATGDVSGDNGIGGLIGSLQDSSVSNVYATGAVTGSTGSTGIGGLVGYNYNGSINNAYATGSVTGNSSVGGLVGENDSNSSISNTYAMGAVTGQNSVGGLVGASFGGISNAYWNMETTGQTTSAGGGIGLTTAQMFDQTNLTGLDFSNIWGNGDNQTTPYLKNLANNQVFNKNDLPSGVISTTNRPALYTAILNTMQLQNINNNLSGRYVIGNHIDASDTVNWNTGAGFNPLGNNITGFSGKFDGLGHTISNLMINRPSTDYVGLFGYTINASIRNIGLLGGSITGRYNVGGLVGQNYNNSSISNAYTTGSVTGLGDVGGLAGVNFNNSSISNAYATGLVTGQSIVGGLVGLNLNNSSISNAYATGSVTGQSLVGGLVGYNDNNSTISNTYATGAVTGLDYVGGLAGFNNGSISNAYVTGAVTGTNYAGGLVGYNDNNSTISNAYATGLVTGQNYAGGLVGYNANGSISNAYWNMETTGQLSGVGFGSNAGVGLTTAQMLFANSFVGFDIDDQGGTGKVWRIYEGQTNPLLRSFLTQATLNAQNQSLTYNGQTQGLNTSIFTGLDYNKLFSSQSSSKNVGTYNLSYYSNQQGYDLINNAASLTINKAAATVTANSLNTTYNGLNQTVSGFTASGLVNGETAAVLSNVSASVTEKNAGSYANQASGTDSNYELTFIDGALDIGKAAATVTANSLNTTYNGLNQTVSGFTASGLVNGETAAVLSNVSASVTEKNAGSYANQASGTDSNYELTFIDGALDIGKAAATVTANSLNTTYNGLNQTVSGFTASGLVNGETAAVLSNVSASVTEKNAGSYANQASGTDSNYELTFIDGALDIGKAAATVTANSLNTTYNGLNQTVSGFTASGLVNGETAAVLSNVSASVTEKNAGSYANQASGTDSNYELTFIDGALDIGKAAATVTANSLNTTYNGLNQTVSGFTASGLVNGETAAVLSNVSASVTEKNAGSYANQASGTDSNYELTFIDGALDIGKAAATVTANSLNTTYNGLNQTVSGFTASGLVNGETAAVLSNVSASVTEKNAGSYANQASGTDSNYELTFVDGSLEIGKAAATVTANSLNTTYNGLNQTVSGFTASGLVNGETAAVLSNVSASVTEKNAGSYVNQASGTDSNYELTFIDGALDIGKAAATVTANSLNTTYNGLNQTVSGFTASGLVNGETAAVLSNVSASVTEKNAGSYANQASGTDSNYELTFIDGALDIGKAAATVTANSLNTTYNGLNQTVSGFTASGLVNGETESDLSCVSAEVTGKNAGSYVNQASGTDSNYELTFVDGSLDIDKAQATVTANSLSTTYNGLNQTVSGFTASGLVNGETESDLSCVSASVTGKEVGSYRNIATGIDHNYELTFVDGSLDITKAKADLYMFTPAYMQAIQFRHPHNLPTTTEIKTADIQIIDGGVNLTGLNMLTGEH